MVLVWSIGIGNHHRPAEAGKAERVPTREGWTFGGLSRLFKLPVQRHRSGMIVEFFVEFGVELVRALLVEELLGRVRSMAHGSRNIRRTVASLHRRNSERLLNRLLTDLEEDL